jgi:hypothetical protein
MKLGTLLLRNAAISLTQLEAALRAQVIYGGRLGTNLVELGFVELEALAGYLGELTQLPVATRALLEAAPAEALALVDGATAERLGAMPIGVSAPPQAALAVAMIEPFDVAAVEELQSKAGMRVIPYVVPELRLLYYLEKAYGLPRKARFVRAGTRRSPTAKPWDNRRREQPAGGIVLPPAVRLEPRKRNRSVPPVEVAAPTARSEDPTPVPRLGWAFAVDRLDHASQRDQIADVFLDFAVGRFDATVVFLVRDGNALGWYGRLATGQPLTPIDQISLPLGPASSFQIAHDGMRLYHGPAPTGVHPTENRLWEALGTPPPGDLVVAPIPVKQRVVNLVYAHGPGGGPINVSDAAELAELAVRAADAYVRLIKRSKT